MAMSERMQNQTNMSRAEVFNLGVVCTQLGIDSPKELASIIILGSRIHWQHEEVSRAVETLNRVLR